MAGEYKGGPKIPAVCLECQEKFMARANKVKAGGGRFCSISCSSRYHAKRRPQFTSHGGNRNPSGNPAGLAAINNAGKNTHCGSKNGAWKGGVAKENKSKRRKQWAAQHLVATKAQMTLRNAVRSGKVKKQPCSVCGETKNVHGHHADYSKPLEVVWLCHAHHMVLSPSQSKKVR